MRDAERYKAQRRKEVATGTVNRELAYFKAALNKAVAWKLLKVSPIAGVKLFKETPKERYLTEEEIERLYPELPKWLDPIVTVALNTGLRRGEILSLTWDKVDWETGFLRLERTKSGKTRYVPVNAATRDALSRVPRRLDTAYVFARQDGEPRGGDSTGKAFKKACRRAGISDATFHVLRHTAITNLVQGGADLRTVQAISGHASLAMLQRYSHLANDHLQAAVDRLSYPTGIGTVAEIVAEAPDG